MSTNCLFSNAQYGFLAGKSCVSQLIDVLDDWTTYLDLQDNVDVVYTDFMKAFDKVPHNRLLVKLRSYGICGDILKWIECFLFNRQQRVVVEGQYSDWAPICSGVPQGSVLGPILFLVYINDLPNYVSGCQAKIFADDTKLYKRIITVQDCEVLQKDIDNIFKWSEKWQLRFHPDKCQVLRLGQTIPQFHYSMQNYDGSRQLLNTVTAEKDLGIMIDKDLNFRLHTSLLVAKANSTLGIIRRTFRYLDRNSFLLLYKAMVRPIIEYGIPAWTPLYLKEVDEIEAVQRRATKIIPGFSDLSYEERLRSLELPTLAYRRLRGDMIYVYKFMTGAIKTDHTLFTRAKVTSTRGHSFKLIKQRVNSRQRQTFFTQRVVTNWNSLPHDVVNSPSLNCFKSRLDVHWNSFPGLYDYRECVSGSFPN